MDLIKIEFGPKCERLATITADKFEEALERISKTYAADQSSKASAHLKEYSLWLASANTYSNSSGEQVIELPKDVASSSIDKRVSVHRISATVKVS